METLDLIVNPNVFGEVIRDLAFDTHNDPYALGCYSAFDLRDGWDKVPKDDSRHLAMTTMIVFEDWFSNRNIQDLDDADIEEEIEYLNEVVSHVTTVTNGNLMAAWYWDGDGVLVVSNGNLYALNDDCKKDHVWMYFSPEPLFEYLRDYENRIGPIWKKGQTTLQGTR